MTDIKRISYQNIDANINIVKSDVLKLASLVIYQFEFAIADLQSGDIEVTQQVQDLNDQACALKLHIQNKSISYLTERKSQPLELKVILNTLKITNDLGLINDQIGAIVRHVEIFIKQHTKQAYWGMPHIAHCASVAIDMLKKSVSTFALLDASNATQILLLDKQITEEYNFITGRLMGSMLTGPRSISLALDILHIAKSIESIANHSKYISQLVIDAIKEYEKLNVVQTERMMESS